MLVQVTLVILLLIAIFPLIFLTILGATKSSLSHICVTLIGPLVLVGLATFPWWLPFLSIGVSELKIIYWGGFVGATIGALVPSWKFFMDENHQLLRWGYTSGLFGTRNDAKETLEWAFAMIILILLAPPKVNSPVPPGILTIPLGTLIGLGACWLVH